MLSSAPLCCLISVLPHLLFRPPTEDDRQHSMEEEIEVQGAEAHGHLASKRQSLDLAWAHLASKPVFDHLC